MIWTIGLVQSGANVWSTSSRKVEKDVAVSQLNVAGEFVLALPGVQACEGPQRWSAEQWKRKQQRKQPRRSNNRVLESNAASKEDKRRLSQSNPTAIPKQPCSVPASWTFN